MYKTLRIICAIISALFLAVIVPAAFMFDTNGLLLCAFGAGLFFFLTLIFKKAQQNWEEKNGIVDKTDTEPLDTPKDEEDTKKNPTAATNKKTPDSSVKK